MAESRARSLANLGNQNVLSVDSSSLDVGISSASPDSDLNVGASIKMDGPSGVVTATTFSGSFSGDGSALTGVANTDFIVSVATTAARVVVTGGVNVTGVVTAASFTGDGANLTNVGVDTATVDTGSLNVSGISTLTGAVGFGNSATFDDGASKGVYLGNSHDLQLYHSGNSFIKNVNNSVDLRIISDAVDIKGNSSDEQLAKFTLNGSVDLYYNNVNRLETATHGVNFEHAGTASTSRINPGGSVGVGIGVTNTTGRDAVGAAGTVKGQIVFNETDGVVQVYTGTEWRAVEGKTTVSGGTETTSGSYTIHTFTSSGSLVVTGSDITADYLVVGGGGGGGGTRGGGGGAGGMVETPGGTIPVGTHTVTIGGGGNGGPGVDTGAVGEASSLGSIQSASGGGYGGGQGNPGGNGGSGGGGSDGQGGGEGTPGQGNDGGGSTGATGGGGGGGKDGAGNQGPPTQGGPGGAAGSSSYSGSTVNYSGGGGGGSRDDGTVGNGGGGNAGPGGKNPTNLAGNAGINQGGGGGGGGRHPTGAQLPGGNGGSGIVIVRYLTSSL